MTSTVFSPCLPESCPLPRAHELAAILTGKAVIDVLLTVHTTEARQTLTHVPALGVVAQAMVRAGLGHTLINVNSAALTYK